MNKINGQTSIFLLDLKGKEYPAIAEVNRKKRVNGQREITLSFLYEDINADFIHDIEFGWKILFKAEWYTITSPSYALDGDKFSVGVEAVLSFFVDMNGHYLQDEIEDKSITPGSFFTELFKGTGYSYVLVDNLVANTLNYQANQSKTERFLYGIDRFKGEYVIRGKVAYIHGLIGSDKGVILHEDLNIQDVSIEVDASGFHTFALGFGDKDDSVENSDYKLKVEYPSPLIAKYGKIEGPAIRDGSFKHGPALIEAVKKQVENSYTVSTTITPIDLTNNGYPEMHLEEGDRVWVYVDRLKLNTQVRVVEIDETFDWEGNIIGVQYTVGNEGIAARYKTQQYDTLKDWRDISLGKKTLEFNWLPDAIKRAADIINGNLDSHFSYHAGEIIGINRSNPNEYMRFNTDGLGFSRNGGKDYTSAITHEGINADYGVFGTLRGILIEGVEIRGSRFISELSPTQYMKMDSSTLTSRGLFPRTWGGVSDTADLQLGLYNGHIRINNIDTGYNLYMTEKGLSTTVAGASPISAGTLEFHSQRYNAVSRGVTLHSTYGTAALVSEYSTVVLESDLTANIESRRFSVYIRPYKDSLPGNNEFRYWIKDGGAASRTDGVFSFGSPANQINGAALRFSKGDNVNTVYATNINGDIGTGDFDANHFYGALRAKATHAYVLAAYDGELRVTDKKGYNGGSMSLRPVYALSYHTPSNPTSSQGFSSLRSMPIEENEATEAIREIDLIRYTDGGEPSYKLPSESVFDVGNGESSDMMKVVMYLLKSSQEQSIEIDKLKGVS